ncbi:MAG TPA: LuxR C-terminal-related transcriptional regulator [Acidimicrobiia bacterium]
MDSTDSGSVKGAPAPTPREREVLALLAERLTNREIADRLYVSVRTVESHVSSLLVKTGAANRRELAEKARALLRAMPAHNLPPRRTTFVGREEELGTTIGLLEEHRQVTLAGPPGVGKTRLAIEVGRAWLDRTGDGVYLVELASLRDPDLVTTEVQSILRAPSASTIDPLRSLADHVGSRPLLIVLDNCEHVRTPAAKVAETLVDSCPRVKVIATSRVVLGTKSEQVLTVGPLEREPAVRLFLERSGGTWGDRELGALVSRLDGLPLAIELAAARSRVFEPEELVSELERGFSVLASIATDSRYQTLEGAINWSYQLLDPTDRDLLAAVTVFQGGFSLEAAKRVCAGSPHVAPSLARLVDHSLLTVTRAGRSRRFRLLESIKTFAAEFRDPDVDRAHADYCLDLAARASSGLRGRSQQRWLETLDTELDELRGAFDWARRNDPEIALALRRLLPLLGVPGSALGGCQVGRAALRRRRPARLAIRRPGPRRGGLDHRLPRHHPLPGTGRASGGSGTSSWGCRGSSSRQGGAGPRAHPHRPRCQHPQPLRGGRVLLRERRHMVGGVHPGASQRHRPKCRGRQTRPGAVP